MLADTAALGGEILPSDKNVATFGQLFDAYVEGRLTGVALVAEDEAGLTGALLWGQGGVNPFETTWGYSAMAWGTVVAKRARGRGLSTALRREGRRWLRQYGFDTVVGSAVDTNDAGIGSGLGSGGFRLHGIIGVVDLREAT